MKFTQVKPDAFEKLVLNAGIIVEGDGFNPATGVLVKSKILCASTGGFSFAANPTYRDEGADVDNCPDNTLQLKRVTAYDPAISGTALSVDSQNVKTFNGAADIDPDNTAHIVPRTDLKASDFKDIWLIADYSNQNTGANAGFVAIHLKNCLNTGGFQMTTTKDGKAQFAFDFHAHYDLGNISEVPFDIYIQSGEASSAVVTLSALTIADTTLSPTFAAGITDYTASTTDTTNVITATPTDMTNAAVAITVNGNSLTSGTAATWKTGANSVVVIVTNADATKRYNITVTKSAS